MVPEMPDDSVTWDIPAFFKIRFPHRTYCSVFTCEVSSGAPSRIFYKIVKWNGLSQIVIIFFAVNTEMETGVGKLLSLKIPANDPAVEQQVSTYELIFSSS